MKNNGLGERDSLDHTWALGGGLLGCLPPPPKARKLTLQVYRPRNQTKTYNM